MPFDHAGFIIDPPKLKPHEKQLVVLRAARMMIKAHPERWIKGAYNRDDGRCAVGWLRHFSSRFRADRIVRSALVPVLPYSYQQRVFDYPDSIGNIVQNYNDDTKTTHADIVALFDCAIMRLEYR